MAKFANFDPARLWRRSADREIISRPLPGSAPDRETPLPRTTTLQAAVVLMLCCVVAPMADAVAAPLQRVEFDSAAQRMLSGGYIEGERIQGYLARPDGPGPFPAVVGLHGCGGMHDTTRQKLADELVGRGYVLLLVDSYATRGIVHACTSSAFATFLKRRADVYGALVFLSGQNFVDSERVAAVGFSSGGWLTLSVAESNPFEIFAPASTLRFRTAIAFNPPCQRAATRPAMPTLILIGALDDWTPAAECSSKVADWGNEGPPVELVVYPGTYHGFYYRHLQPGVTMFGHWLEYNAEAADDATQRLHTFLDRHLK